jgi:hypothetical protein
VYSAEQILQALSYQELYDTLKSIVNEDCYLVDYITCELAGDFMYMLEVYDLIWIASDDRIMLTPKGEKVLLYVTQVVELSKKSKKVKAYKL